MRGSLALSALLAALLLAAALVAPRPALAHGAARHESAIAAGAAPVRTEQAQTGRAALVPACPGEHGEFCTCGGPAACSGSGKLALAAAPLAVLALVPPARGEPRRESLARAPPRAFSLRLSRAPPSFS